MPKFFFPQEDKIVETRRLHAQGNVRFMKSAFVKETLGEERSWSEEDCQIAVRDGHSIPLRIYRPIKAPGGLPVMVFAHSGGSCMGSLDTEEFVCRLLTIRLGLIIVSVGYRLAPEWKWPTHVLDTYDAMKWVGQSGAELPAC
jgi:acetyl esterase/lipase